MCCETHYSYGRHGYGEGTGMGYGHRKWGGHHSDCCCCCHHGGGRHHGHGGMMKRHFTSKAEIAAELEEYLKQLQAEARGVEEHIAKLKKES